ncbi:MAG TPA: nickel pincer cofactor biosynthesis protein LarC [Actinomycetota bacterium]|jgi:uncharacterized protein (TIGR00299 family) protein|nr:nickel pincer cofactor biosynthesis protein LarC [Actinomycetota bacterium]
MTRIAYFDLASGASGDMIIAALADAGRRLGIDVQTTVSDAIESLGLGCGITFVDDERGGLACLRAEVKTDSSTLTARELRSALERADLADAARRRALAGLDALVGAEAVVHGTSIEDVHLHELGSADTAADLVGASSALHVLGVADVHAAPVPVPSGWIASGHGALPLPAPVTLELLAGAALRGIDATSELVTPTGAAILVAHDAAFGAMPELTLIATGTGGGTRDTSRPNISRVLLGERAEPGGTRIETCVLLETNIDDQTPESIGYALEALMRVGALDAWVTPILMKKTRPAFQLSVLVHPSDEARIAESVFRHTTTLGVRRRETTRWALEREELRVRVGGGDVRVKVARIADEIVTIAPEFQDCVAVAERRSAALKDVYDEALRNARAALGERS